MPDSTIFALGGTGGDAQPDSHLERSLSSFQLVILGLLLEVMLQQVVILKIIHQVQKIQVFII